MRAAPARLVLPGSQRALYETAASRTVYGMIRIQSGGSHPLAPLGYNRLSAFPSHPQVLYPETVNRDILLS